MNKHFSSPSMEDFTLLVKEMSLWDSSPERRPASFKTLTKEPMFVTQCALTPHLARFFLPPCSRSKNTKAVSTTRPWLRSNSAVSSTLAPLVITSWNLESLSSKESLDVSQEIYHLNNNTLLTRLKVSFQDLTCPISFGFFPSDQHWLSSINTHQSSQRQCRVRHPTQEITLI